MAIFHENILLLLRETMFIDLLGLPSSVSSEVSTRNIGITLHGGVQPTADQVLANWPNDSWSSADFLGYANNALLITSTSSLTLSYTTATNAIRSGTCTWAILWSSGSVSSTSSVSAPTIPTDKFWVVPVSDITTTTGILRMNDTNMVADSSTTVTDLSLVLGGI